MSGLARRSFRQGISALRESQERALRACLGAIVCKRGVTRSTLAGSQPGLLRKGCPHPGANAEVHDLRHSER